MAVKEGGRTAVRDHDEPPVAAQQVVGQRGGRSGTGSSLPNPAEDTPGPYRDGPCGEATFAARHAAAADQAGSKAAERAASLRDYSPPLLGVPDNLAGIRPSTSIGRVTYRPLVRGAARIDPAGSSSSPGRAPVVRGRIPPTNAGSETARLSWLTPRPAWPDDGRTQWRTHNAHDFGPVPEAIGMTPAADDPPVVPAGRLATTIHQGCRFRCHRKASPQTRRLSCRRRARNRGSPSTTLLSLDLSDAVDDLLPATDLSDIHTIQPTPPRISTRSRRGQATGLAVTMFRTATLSISGSHTVWDLATDHIRGDEQQKWVVEGADHGTVRLRNLGHEMMLDSNANRPVYGHPSNDGAYQMWRVDVDGDGFSSFESFATPVRARQQRRASRVHHAPQ